MLPIWVEWAPLLVYPVLTALLSFFALWTAMLVAMVPAGGLAAMHWSERARKLYPAGKALIVGSFLLAGMFGTLAARAASPVGRISTRVIVTATVIAALLAGYSVRFAFSRRFWRQDLTLKQFLSTLLSHLFVLYPHLIVVGAVALVVPRRMNLSAVALLTAAVLLLLLCARGAGMQMALWAGLAHPAGARLRGVVEKAAARMGVEAPGTFELRSRAANAFANLLGRRLIFTERLLEVLDDEELSAITAHELGHLAERRAVVVARSLGVLLLLPLAAARPAFGSFGQTGLAVMVVAELAGLLLFARLARRMEQRADESAHQQVEKEGTYARALERIYEDNLAPAVSAGRRPIHTHLYDRMKDCGVTPSFPRPRPPSRIRTAGAILSVALVGAAGACAAQARLLPGPWPLEGDERGYIRYLAFGDAPAECLAGLGFIRLERNEIESARTFFQAAAEIEQGDSSYPALFALALVNKGRCDEARSVVDETVRGAASAEFEDTLLEEAEEAVRSCGQEPPRKD